jgi:hypothetical protein
MIEYRAILAACPKSFNRPSCGEGDALWRDPTCAACTNRVFNECQVILPDGQPREPARPEFTLAPQQPGATRRAMPESWRPSLWNRVSPRLTSPGERESKIFQWRNEPERSRFDGRVRRQLWIDGGWNARALTGRWSELWRRHYRSSDEPGAQGFGG